MVEVCNGFRHDATNYHPILLGDKLMSPPIGCPSFDCGCESSTPNRVLQQDSCTIQKSNTTSLQVNSNNASENQVDDITNVSFKHIRLDYAKHESTSQDNSIHCQLNGIEIDGSLVEYLVRHGALSELTGRSILNAPVAERKKLLLHALCLNNIGMNCSNETNNPGLALLLNALRHTGQHSIASLLDSGRRIKPSPIAKQFMDVQEGHSSELSERLRGQLSLWIQLNAIKIDPQIYEQLKNPRLETTVEEQHSLVTKSNGAPMLPSFVEYLDSNSTRLSKSSAVWINHSTSETRIPDIPVVEVPKVKKCRPTGCFSSLRRFFAFHKKRKVKKSLQSPESVTFENSVRHFPSSIPPTTGDCTAPCVHEEPNPMQEKLAILDAKSLEFCNALSDQDSFVHDTLVKHLEQVCGVLVLNTQTHHPSTSLHVIVVATRLDLIKRLADSCVPLLNTDPTPASTCRLAENLSKILIDAGLLDYLELQDLRLSCKLDQGEIDLATQELTQSNK